MKRLIPKVKNASTLSYDWKDKITYDTPTEWEPVVTARRPTTYTDLYGNKHTTQTQSIKTNENGDRYVEPTSVTKSNLREAGNGDMTGIRKGIYRGENENLTFTPIIDNERDINIYAANQEAGNVNLAMNDAGKNIFEGVKQMSYFIPGVGNVVMSAEMASLLANGDAEGFLATVATMGGIKIGGKALKELITNGKIINSSAPADINIVNRYRVGNIDKAIIDGVADAKNYYDSGRFVGKAMRNGISRADAEEFAKWASESIDDIEFHNGFPERDLVGARVIGENAGAMSDIARNPDRTAILYNGKPIRAVYVNTGSKYSVNHEVGGHNVTLNYDPNWSDWNTINGAPEHILPTLKRIMDNANELAFLLEPLEEFKNWENTYNYYKSIGHSDERARFLSDFLHKDTHYKGGAINGYYKLGLEARARWKAGELDMLDHNITLQQLEESLRNRRLLSISDAGWSLFTPKSMKKLYKGMYGVAPITIGYNAINSLKLRGKLKLISKLK